MSPALAAGNSRAPLPPVNGTANFEEPLALLRAVNARASTSIARINPPSKQQFDATSHKRARPALPERAPLASTSLAPVRRSSRETAVQTKKVIAELLKAEDSQTENDDPDDDDSDFGVKDNVVREDDDDDGENEGLMVGSLNRQITPQTTH